MGLPEFEWHPESVPSLKLGLHIAQIVLAFVVFALEISVFRDDKAEIVGNNGWTFGVCFLSIPAWIYLCMAPRFPRTRKLANPTVMAIVDGVYAVFWLSGFASQAAYNSANQCGGACGRSKGIVGLGFIIFLLFCATTVLSIYSVKYHEWNGRLPGYEHPSAGGQNIDPDKAAFSTNMHDEEAYAHIPMNDQDDHDDPTLRDRVVPVPMVTILAPGPMMTILVQHTLARDGIRARAAPTRAGQEAHTRTPSGSRTLSMMIRRMLGLARLRLWGCHMYRLRRMRSLIMMNP